MQSHWNSLVCLQDDPSQVNCTGCETVGFLGAGPLMIVAVHLPFVQLERNPCVSVYYPSGWPAATLVPAFGPTMNVIAYSPFQDAV